MEVVEAKAAETKTCEYCGKQFGRDAKKAAAQFANRRFCSRECWLQVMPGFPPPRFITVGNESKRLSEWAKLSGNSPSVIDQRLRLGWTPHDAVWTPTHRYRSRKAAAPAIDLNGSHHLSPAQQLAALIRGTQSEEGPTGPAFAGKCLLTESRVKVGLSMENVAKATGINAGTIKRYETGGEPGLSLAFRLAKFFGVTVYDLWPEFADGSKTL